MAELRLNPGKQLLIEQASWAPSDPRRSADLSILLAWMDADPAPSCLQPVPADPDMSSNEQRYGQRCGRCAACRRHQATVVAAVETAVRQAEEVQSRRRLGWYWSRMSPGVRALIAQSHGEGLKGLLGYWDKGGGFVDGLAGLSEREAQAYWLRLRGWSSWLIAKELTAANRRGDRKLWISVQTVYSLCSKAKAKVLVAFGLPASVDDSEEWG